jgi:hypothetical protein
MNEFLLFKVLSIIYLLFTNSEFLCFIKVPRSAPTLTVPQEFQFYTEKRALIHKETGHCNYGGQVKPIFITAFVFLFSFGRNRLCFFFLNCGCLIQESSLPYIPVAEMVQKFQMNLLGDFRTQVCFTSLLVCSAFV